MHHPPSHVVLSSSANPKNPLNATCIYIRNQAAEFRLLRKYTKLAGSLIAPWRRVVANSTTIHFRHIGVYILIYRGRTRIWCVLLLLAYMGRVLRRWTRRRRIHFRSSSLLVEVRWNWRLFFCYYGLGGIVTSLRLSLIDRWALIDWCWSSTYLPCWCDNWGDSRRCGVIPATEIEPYACDECSDDSHSSNNSASNGSSRC